MTKLTFKSDENQTRIPGKQAVFRRESDEKQKSLQVTGKLKLTSDARRYLRIGGESSVFAETMRKAMLNQYMALRSRSKGEPKGSSLLRRFQEVTLNKYVIRRRTQRSAGRNPYRGINRFPFYIERK